MASFPNQRTVTIHKPLYEGNFVQVDIDDWQETLALLTKSSFGLYLYLYHTSPDVSLPTLCLRQDVHSHTELAQDAFQSTFLSESLCA